MEIKVIRKYRKEEYTIGALYIDGVYFCDTLEDKDRGLTSKMPAAKIQSKKVYAETAIPYGDYEITLDVVSAKFMLSAFYRKNANGAKLPRLKDVPGFSGVLIHCGVTALHSAGCILIGKNTAPGKLSDSQPVFTDFYNKLKAAWDAKEKITISIVKE